MKPDYIYPLCFECGLCCNGVIFANVELGAEDRRASQLLPGLAAGAASAETNPDSGKRGVAGARQSRIATRKFPQPCAAFDGCRCRIYDDRPRYCREFECLLLRDVNAGRMDRAAALRVIRTARQRAERVKRLLMELGDDEEHVALSIRFRRIKRRMERQASDDEAVEIFSRLTLAVHELNVLLREAFYR